MHAHGAESRSFTRNQRFAVRQGGIDDWIPHDRLASAAKAFGMMTAGISAVVVPYSATNQ